MIADDEKAGHTMNLGKAHMHLTLTNHYESAISETMKEYQMRPENIDVNKALAEAHYHKGNLSKAGEHLKIATRTNSEDLILSHNLTELVHFVKITTLPTVLTVGLNEKARTVTVLTVSDLVS